MFIVMSSDEKTPHNDANFGEGCSVSHMHSPLTNVQSACTLNQASLAQVAKDASNDITAIAIAGSLPAWDYFAIRWIIKSITAINDN